MISRNVWKKLIVTWRQDIDKGIPEYYNNQDHSLFQKSRCSSHVYSYRLQERGLNTSSMDKKVVPYSKVNNF